MRFRSQSAMEYLMTYGWAVIIIAVVLAALVFSGRIQQRIVGPQGISRLMQTFQDYRNNHTRGRVQ